MSCVRTICSLTLAYDSSSSQKEKKAIEKIIVRANVNLKKLYFFIYFSWQGGVLSLKYKSYKARNLLPFGLFTSLFNILTLYTPKVK